MYLYSIIYNFKRLFFFEKNKNVIHEEQIQL